MSVKIYHNPRCKKSRAGLAYLQSKDIDIIVIDYIKNGLDPAELKDLISHSGLSVLEFVRTQEDFYKKNLKGKNLSLDNWIKSISENPKLLRRPLVIRNKKMVFGDPPKNIDLLFN